MTAVGEIMFIINFCLVHGFVFSIFGVRILAGGIFSEFYSQFSSCSSYHDNPKYIWFMDGDNLTKVRPLFTLSHRGSDNSPLLFVFT